MSSTSSLFSHTSKSQTTLYTCFCLMLFMFSPKSAATSHALDLSLLHQICYSSSSSTNYVKGFFGFFSYSNNLLLHLLFSGFFVFSLQDLFFFGLNETI
ncbi:hypothetical protein QL285_059134 [Trifolium repens]|nr:hypothetical protein QL285_059134 [Trifolium repens]